MRIELKVIDDLNRVQTAEECVQLLAVAVTRTQHALLTKQIGETAPEPLALPL